jgi:thioredoxin reductase/bacterioferritin-associated ferredoxin
MTDLIVIGAGPAGAAAATRAAALGLRVLLLEDQPEAGGQVYRAPAGTRPVPDSPELRSGTALRQALAASGVETRFGHQVWSVSGDFRVDALGPTGPCYWHAPALIVATGAQERVVPFPGWTLPGVIGLAATTLMLKAHGAVPGARTLVAGCGPLLGAVAVGILKAGGQVAAVADLSGIGDWARRLPALSARPDLLARGAGWAATLRRAGVPILFRTTLAEVEPFMGGLRARLCPVDAGGRPLPGEGRVLEADAVAVGHGLLPSTEITRLLRVAHHFDARAGSWAARLDADGRTSRPGLLVAGDGGGVQGAAAAPLRGELAALAAARGLGRLDTAEHERLAAPLRRRLGRAARFGQAMAGMMAPRAGQLETIPPEVVICRCEDVTRAEIEAAAAEGAREVNQLKAWTRCGMGPCQGRVCGDTAAALLARHHGIGREEAGLFTGRTPLRPLPLDQLTGDFGYADIALPPPAPL